MLKPHLKNMVKLAEENTPILHTFDEAVPLHQMPGTFTPLANLPKTDILFTKGLHGGVANEDVDVANTWIC